jgi:hypothetical protein
VKTRPRCDRSSPCSRNVSCKAADFRTAINWLDSWKWSRPACCLAPMDWVATHRPGRDASAQSASDIAVASTLAGFTSHWTNIMPLRRTSEAGCRQFFLRFGLARFVVPIRSTSFHPHQPGLTPDTDLHTAPKPLFVIKRLHIKPSNDHFHRRATRPDARMGSVAR